MVRRYHAATYMCNSVYQKNVIYYIYPRMTEVNVSATVGMSVTVGEMSATVGKLINMV